MIDLAVAELDFTLGVLRRAAELARAIQQDSAGATLQKEDRSPVTVADYSVQSLIAQALDETFPGETLVAEEDSRELRRSGSGPVLERVSHWVDRTCGPCDSERIFYLLDRGAGQPTQRFWTLDPIDGTKGFLRGGHYAVALALIVDGRVEVGGLGCPHWSPDQIWQPNGPGGVVLAARGQGAWWTPLGTDAEQRRLRVSNLKNARQARVLRSVEAGHTNVDRLGDFLKEIQSRTEPIRMDSQAKYAALAGGQGDLLLRLPRSERPIYREKIWDHAAGAIVLEEAGGRISDLDGTGLDFMLGRTLAKNRGLLASNGLLHSEALAALASGSTRG